MSIISRMRKQKAVWWQRLAADRYGAFSYAAPVEIDCRWDDANENYITPQGEQATSQALVYIDRVMALGDRLLLGEMDSTTPDNPLDVQSYEIKRIDTNPNFRATEFLRVAYL